MSLTPNFGLNIPDAGDIVNLLTQCYPNFTLIDTAMQSIKETGVTTATETKSGTTHQIVRTVADCNVLRFTATSKFVTGDSFTVDGVPVVGVAVNGTSLQTGDFVINSDVMAILNGGKLTLFAGGANVPDASDVNYDNTGSGLTATNVQDAIDELKGDIPTSLDADDVAYDNTGSGLTATNVQDAIDEVNNKITAGSVQVVADGVKTISQICDELYALIDRTKLKGTSVLKIVGSTQTFTLHLTSITSTRLTFVAEWLTSSHQYKLWNYDLMASGSEIYQLNGSFTASSIGGSVGSSGDTWSVEY